MRKFPLKLYNTETTKFLTQQDFSRNLALREKCPNTGECGRIQTRKNSVFRHFSRSLGEPY